MEVLYGFEESSTSSHVSEHRDTKVFLRIEFKIAEPQIFEQTAYAYGTIFSIFYRDVTVRG